ncbi:MAG: hypothetical protein COV72_05460 [Candidatus Omnitrophica bacterium CG11_big_fil_rev_8_21_14_0_20_42_13]|uniref:PilZ domain-containing protein n=1 Tax=Candidatus Ghiorseimicrobium undicola TaxID=1974746 RepID=A0A2H0LX60_9BACT|nr:MAG: hypothetical protein COV72_05460 [Candidatus Omnitrophica bacterium CG11_big_fil_rev_8_21_14_0_20_42_13]
MTDESFKEKRRFMRFENTNINFKAKDMEKTPVPSSMAQAVAVNMSTEGICFLCSLPLEPGTIVELDIEVPFQPTPAHLEGEVRWSKPIKTEEGKNMFDTGVRLLISKTDETKFFLFICNKMEERIKELEEKLENK